MARTLLSSLDPCTGAARSARALTLTLIALTCFTVALAGCGPVDQNDIDGDGVPIEEDCDDRNASIGSAYADGDADGYGTGDPLAGCDGGEGTFASKGGDCDDANPEIHPDVTEVCDGVDNNCDLKTDDLDTTTFYRDGDGDGFGDATRPLNDCRQPPAYVRDNTDCDDQHETVYPGAEEVCDLLDNDCNNQTDEGLPTSTWYGDSDHDGYGDDTDTVEACAPPEGYVEEDTDCDDTDFTVHPNALEICNGIDEDCTEVADDAPEFTYYADADKDEWGDPSQPKVSCNGVPGGHVIQSGDCNDADASIHPGATDVCDHKDNDCNGVVDENGNTDYFTDADGDTWGNSSSVKKACGGTGLASRGGDCDDNNKTIYPGAYDAFDDGWDSNCNSLQDWITSPVGTGAADYTGDSGLGSKATLKHPYGVAADADGAIYIADTDNSRVRRVSPSGVITTVAGGGTELGDNGPATEAMLSRPYGVTVDTVGNLFIADTFNSRIRMVDARDGTISTFAGTGQPNGKPDSEDGDGGAANRAQLNHPTAVALDENGVMYVADTDHHRIRKIDLEGIITNFAGDVGGYSGFTGDNGPATSARLYYPSGLSVGLSGSVYIADTYNNRIRRVDNKGIITTVAGSSDQGDFSGDGGQATKAELNYPQSVVVDEKGNYFISDTESCVIRMVGTNGVIFSVAGQYTDFEDRTETGPYAGPSTSARFYTQGGIARDPYGLLYIADTGNNIIRVLNW